LCCDAAFFKYKDIISYNENDTQQFYKIKKPKVIITSAFTFGIHDVGFYTSALHPNADYNDIKYKKTRYNEMCLGEYVDKIYPVAVSAFTQNNKESLLRLANLLYIYLSSYNNQGYYPTSAVKYFYKKCFLCKKIINTGELVALEYEAALKIIGGKKNVCCNCFQTEVECVGYDRPYCLSNFCELMPDFSIKRIKRKDDETFVYDKGE
jgi:hypothetical protein